MLPEVDVRMGTHSPSSVLDGNSSFTTISTSRVSVIPADVQFVIFIQSSGQLSSMTVAQRLVVQPIPFVRRLYVDMGFPSNQRRNAPLNAWNNGAVSVSDSKEFEPITLYTKPHPARPEAVVAVLSRKLLPGVYRLGLKEELPGFTPPGMLFAVGGTVEGEVAKCVDLTEKYQMLLSTRTGLTCATAGLTDTIAAVAKPKLCPDTNSCIATGEAQFRNHRWTDVIQYLQTAARYDSRRAAIHPTLAKAKLAAGSPDALEDFLVAILTGDVLAFDVCHEVTLTCQQAALTISRSEVTLRNAQGKTQFSVPPNRVNVVGINRQVSLSRETEGAYIRLDVDGKKYNLDPVPVDPSRGQSTRPGAVYREDAWAPAGCRVDTFLRCTGVVEQMIQLGNVIAQSLKFAAAPLPSGAACSGSDTAAYKITLGGTVYQVGTMSTNARPDGYVFADLNNRIVTDPSLVQRLSATASTIEGVVTTDEIDFALRTATVALETSAALDRYTLAQDLIVRSTIEAMKAAATGGGSLTAAISSVTVNVIKGELASPEAYFAKLSRAALRDAVAMLQQAQQIKQSVSSPFDADKTLQVHDLFVRGRALQLPFAALASGLLPTSGRQLVEKALNSAATQAIAGLPGEEVVTVQRLLQINELLAQAIATDPVFKRYGDNLKLAGDLSLAERNDLARFVKFSEDTCK